MQAQVLAQVLAQMPGQVQVQALLQMQAPVPVLAQPRAWSLRPQHPAPG
jgi:hypothetical protein